MYYNTNRNIHEIWYFKRILTWIQFASVVTFEIQSNAVDFTIDRDEYFSKVSMKTEKRAG